MKKLNSSVPQRPKQMALVCDTTHAHCAVLEPLASTYLLYVYTVFYMLE